MAHIFRRGECVVQVMKNQLWEVLQSPFLVSDGKQGILTIYALE